MVLSPWWHLTLSGTALLVVACNVVLLVTKHTVPYQISGTISIAAMLVAEGYHCLRRGDLAEAMRARIYTDSTLFALGVLLLRENVHIILPSYLIVASLHTFVTFFVLQADARILWYIRGQCVAVGMIGWFIYPQVFGSWVAGSLLVTLILVSFAAEHAHRREIRRQHDLTRAHELETRMLRHNLASFMTILHGYLDQVEEHMPERGRRGAKRALKAIDQAVKAFCNEQAALGVKTIATHVARYCRDLYDVPEVKVDIATETEILTNHSVLFGALLVVASNACESGPQRVIMSLEAGELKIADDGCGFDTSKLKPGYTTKPNGHGQGLIQAIESCKLNGTPLTIASEAGRGTTATFDLTGAIA